MMKTWNDATFFWSHAPDWGKTGRTEITDVQGEVMGALEWSNNLRALRVDAPGSRWEFEFQWLREPDTTERKGVARLFAPARYQSVVLVRSVGTGGEVGRYTLDETRMGGTLTLRNGTAYEWKNEVWGETWAWLAADDTPVLRLDLGGTLPQRAAMMLERETEDTSILVFLACYLILLFQDGATSASMITMNTALSS